MTSTTDEMETNTDSTSSITNRSEIVFLYDAVDTNPNGDPLTEENRPRIDDNTGKALVTDVRLKRVVRDYLDQIGETILIKASGEDGRDDKDDRYEALKAEMEPLIDDNMSEEEAFLAVATDVRLFGESMTFDSPIEDSYTGPVQFGFGRSMHRVSESTYGKTSVVAASSEEGDRSQGGNMFSEHRIDYALMRFHGVINEHNATETHLSNADVELLEDGLWRGTREMTNSASKHGHEPRLFIRIEYAEDNYHLGDLHHTLHIDPDGMDERTMRDISDGILIVDELVSLLAEHKDRIETVYIRASRRLRVGINDTDGDPFDLKLALEDALASERVVCTVE